jgi:hypothetical protein
MKDVGSNSNFMIILLKFVASCEILTLEESFQWIHFGHVISKAYQYVTTNEIFSRGFNYVFMKFEQANLQKYITWPKKSSNGNKKWN